jgi:hypothetical protein
LFVVDLSKRPILAYWRGIDKGAAGCYTHLTGVSLLPAQMPFGLQQQGAYDFMLLFVFSLAERKNEQQKNVKYRCEDRLLTDHYQSCF